MRKSTYAYDLFVMLQKYRSDVAQNGAETRPAKGLSTQWIVTVSLILFIGLCLAGYSALFYYQLVVFPAYRLF